MDAACLALAPVHTGAASTEMSMRRGKRAGAGAEQLRDTMELSFPHVTLWFVARTGTGNNTVISATMTKKKKQNKSLVPRSMKGLFH